MTLNSIFSNRNAFDRVEQAFVAERRKRLLGRIGHGARGLLVWHFGAGGEARDPSEIPIAKVEEFVAKYA